MMKEEGKRQDGTNKKYVMNNKLNQEALDSQDIKEIIYDEVNEKGTLPDDNYKNHMKRFIEIYKYGGGTNTFKESNRQYKFEKEWHGLFLVLFDTLRDNPKFSRDEIKQVETIGLVRKFNNKLVEAIKEYLPEDQKEYIKQHPAYKSIIAEQNMYKKIEYNLQIVFGNMASMPTLQRIKNLVDFNDGLGMIADNIVQNNSYYIHKTNAELSNANEEEKIEKYQELLSSLEELIDYELKLRLYNRKGKELETFDQDSLIEAMDELKDDEDYGSIMKSLHLTKELSFGETINDPEEKKMVEKINRAIEESVKDILEEETNKEILEKVYNVLDGGSFKEESLKRTLEQMITYMSVTDQNIIEKSRGIRRIINMIMYNTTLIQASRDD